VIVSFNSCCLPGFFKFLSSTLELALHNSVAFFKTRTPQPHSSSSSAPVTRSIGHVGCRCSACGLHAPKSLLLFGAREGHVSPFFGRVRCWMGFTVVHLRLGGTGDDKCPPHATVSDGIHYYLYCWQPAF
jgi:hypothetical protein